MIPNASIAILIDRMNEEAQLQLLMRRSGKPRHVHGFWRGEPNPFSVR